MSKRFTDTDKWERPWFRNLPSEYKLLWSYVLDKCDIAGIWYVDLELASFLLGFKYDRNISEGALNKQIEIHGDRWLIKDFIPFQYGNLTDSNKLFFNVQRKLSEFKDGAYMGHKSPINGVKVMDKDKDNSPSFSLERGVGETIPDDLKANESDIKNWLEYKRQKGQRYKPKGLEALWRAIRAIPETKRKESIEHCMANNWAGLFEKTGGKNGQSTTDEQRLKSTGKFAGVAEEICL